MRTVKTNNEEELYGQPMFLVAVKFLSYGIITLNRNVMRCEVWKIEEK